MTSAKKPRTHCKKGHDLSIVGVGRGGRCLECRREYVRANSEAIRESIQLSRWMERVTALRAYGDGSCAICGRRPEDISELELDHVNGDGKEHRVLVNGGNKGDLVAYLKKAGWPNDPPLQTLCGSCHRRKTGAENAARNQACK